MDENELTIEQIEAEQKIYLINVEKKRKRKNRTIVTVLLLAIIGIVSLNTGIIVNYISNNKTTEIEKRGIYSIFVEDSKNTKVELSDGSNIPFKDLNGNNFSIKTVEHEDDNYLIIIFNYNLKDTAKLKINIKTELDKFKFYDLNSNEVDYLGNPV